MKMVKSLLLGSAAGLVAVTAGQAADLPVKAKPVEYVKVCSLYGAGFYYMPGTDLCIKVGGWARTELATGSINGSMTWGPFAGNANSRTSSNYAYRARGYITADVRNQSEYGTVRGYIAVGVSSNDTGLYGSPAVPPSTFSANRVFVQWAGMTAGISQSFYDFYSVPAMQYRGGYLPASDTGDPGWMVWGYTAQLGSGFSATLSAEARRTTQIVDANCATGTATPTCGTTAPGSFLGTATSGGNLVTSVNNLEAGNGAYGGMQTPDIIGNLRVDQAWGAAQVMGVAHEVNASYYGTAAAPTITSLNHPADAWGWAVGAGLKLNFPMVAQGDWFQAQVNYTQGALRYLFFTAGTSNYGDVNGANGAYGVMSDCVYGGSSPGGVLTSATSCQLTTAWGVNAGYEHFWAPAWHQTLYGAYYAVSYGSSANAMLCTVEGGGNGAGGVGSGAVATPGCSNNWSTWGVGTRLQWDVTKTFYLGVEVLYDVLKSGTTFNGALPSSVAVGGSSGINQVASETSWMVSVRAHRDFLP
jgi:hypothetical protein